LNMEAFLLSAFFIVSISIIVVRGFKEVRRREHALKEATQA